MTRLADHLPTRGHVARTCPQPCTEIGCQFCEGGLFACTRCGSFEGATTLECPGEHFDGATADRVCRGELDHVGGRWIEGEELAAMHAAVLENDDLWRRVHDECTRLDDRVAALSELVQRHVPGLDAYLVAELETADRRWGDHLLVAIECIPLPDVHLRDRAKVLLWRHATERRGEPESRDSLWAALRRVASLIDQTELSSFLDFLLPENLPGTRQVALQCIQNVFFDAPPPPGLPGLDALRTCIVDLARGLFDLGVTPTFEEAALVMNAIVAAAHLGTNELPELVKTAARLQRPTLVRRLSIDLLRLSRCRCSRGWNDEPSTARLHEALGILGHDQPRMYR